MIASIHAQNSYPDFLNNDSKDSEEHWLSQLNCYQKPKLDTEKNLLELAGIVHDVAGAYSEHLRDANQKEVKWLNDTLKRYD